ncbi:MAG: oxygen-independent coproporphyrinogen III oxidase [Clostridia bacterium]|nr:oxygen-independent coproporphyrinogen III oxidase [Clostridia bacterium]
MIQKEIGIYVHIPFCKQKCYYCDFYSEAKKESWVLRYIKSLLSEIEKNSNLDFTPKVKTIYIGGGTPSFIDTSYIEQILESIFKKYEVAKDAEITIEVNPGTVTLEKLEVYKKAGVNRVSIGLQSTHNHLLQAIGRIHNYYEFVDAYHFAREAGFENINVDLMIGLPSQTLLEVQDSLEEIISLEPEHISVYSLIIEENTQIENMLKEGKITLPLEEQERKMYWETKRMLEENGYEHYEISNFAKKGYQAKHNVDCWNQKEYFGFGASAHSYINGARYSNIASLKNYVQNHEKMQAQKNIQYHETQSMADKQKEYMLLALRKIQGVSIQEFKRRFIANPIYLYHTELEKLVREELVEIDSDTIKLTNKGIDFANLVWKEFV